MNERLTNRAARPVDPKRARGYLALGGVALIGAVIVSLRVEFAWSLFVAAAWFGGRGLWMLASQRRERALPGDQ